ncbi:acyltransferase [Lichenibacterium minor]|uniref:Acyltransferase n=1 Tax=Lichenibacterium minor TaxID=2316528 RepID=A0A4Q2TXT6_9HYPH|nr:acyltransferase [Lichenibacterium minor]RYC28893.1 acyltransferase [Lichenibacterium minor]
MLHRVCPSRLWMESSASWFRSRFNTYLSISAAKDHVGRPSNPKAGYRPELTGLRGLAIMIVVIGHLFERVWRFYGDNRISSFEHQILSFIATPFTGCCIFFSLSGYSLMLTLKNGRDPFEAGWFKTYGLRRLLRLWPPYAILLVSTYLVLTATRYNPPQTPSFHSGPTSLTLSLLASLALFHDIAFGTFPRLFPPGWFIEDQFQFIITGPVLWSLYGRLPFGLIRMVIGALLVLDFTMLAAFSHDRGSQNIQYALIAFLPYFATGAYMADIHLNVPRRSSNVKLWSICGYCALVTLMMIGMPFDDQFVQTSLRIGCLLILIGVSCRAGTGLQRMTASRWMGRLGAISYSVFLVHLQVLELVIPRIVETCDRFGLIPVLIISSGCGIGAVLVVAAPFYWFVERPWVVAADLWSSRNATINPSARLRL